MHRLAQPRYSNHCGALLPMESIQLGDSNGWIMGLTAPGDTIYSFPVEDQMLRRRTAPTLCRIVRLPLEITFKMDYPRYVASLCQSLL